MCDLQAYDIVSSTQRVDIVITGIMCGTVSNLGKSESSAECIMDEEGSTGESFKILMNFLQSPNKPLLLLLENVKEFTQMRSKRVTKHRAGLKSPMRKQMTSMLWLMIAWSRRRLNRATLRLAKDLRRQASTISAAWTCSTPESPGNLTRDNGCTQLLRKWIAH